MELEAGTPVLRFRKAQSYKGGQRPGPPVGVSWRNCGNFLALCTTRSAGHSQFGSNPRIYGVEYARPFPTPMRKRKAAKLSGAAATAGAAR